jgi:hypothetical protein
MNSKPRFTLKALLTAMLLVSVPLALFVSDRGSLRAAGFFLAWPALLGAANYLWRGWQGMEWGILVGLFTTAVILSAFSSL